MLHWLADHNLEATVASLEGFADLLAGLAHPVASASAGPQIPEGTDAYLPAAR